VKVKRELLGDKPVSRDRMTPNKHHQLHVPYRIFLLTLKFTGTHVLKLEVHMKQTEGETDRQTDGLQLVTRPVREGRIAAV